jgi:hypothetical protein
MYITRLASNGIFSPSNKIHREVGRAKDLSAPLYCCVGGLSTFRGSFQVCLYTVTFIVSCACHLSCDISADAGLLCDEAAVVYGHDKRDLLCVCVCEVFSIIKVLQRIQIQ